MTEITIKSKKITKINTKLKYDQSTLRKENYQNTLQKKMTIMVPIHREYLKISLET